MRKTEVDLNEVDFSKLGPIRLLPLDSSSLFLPFGRPVNDYIRGVAGRDNGLRGLASHDALDFPIRLQWREWTLGGLAPAEAGAEEPETAEPAAGAAADTPAASMPAGENAPGEAKAGAKDAAKAAAPALDSAPSLKTAEVGDPPPVAGFLGGVDVAPRGLLDQAEPQRLRAETAVPRAILPRIDALPLRPKITLAPPPAKLAKGSAPAAKGATPAKPPKPAVASAAASPRPVPAAGPAEAEAKGGPRKPEEREPMVGAGTGESHPAGGTREAESKSAGGSAAGAAKSGPRETGAKPANEAKAASRESGAEPAAGGQKTGARPATEAGNGGAREVEAKPAGEEQKGSPAREEAAEGPKAVRQVDVRPAAETPKALAVETAARETKPSSGEKGSTTEAASAKQPEAKKHPLKAEPPRPAIIPAKPSSLASRPAVAAAAAAPAPAREAPQTKPETELKPEKETEAAADDAATADLPVPSFGNSKLLGNGLAGDTEPRGLLEKIPIAVKIAVPALVLGLGGYYLLGGMATRTAGGHSAVPAPIVVGDQGWVTKDAADTVGTRRGRQMQFYQASSSAADYRFEFVGTVETKALGWFFRAADARNYYGMKIEFARPGSAVLTHFAVVDGRESSFNQRPLGINPTPGAPIPIKLTVSGPRFEVAIQGETVEVWTDNRLSRGAVGFMNERDEFGRAGNVRFSLGEK